MEGTGCPSKSENSKTIKDNIEYLLGNPALPRILIIVTTAVYLRLVNNNKKIEGLSFFYRFIVFIEIFVSINLPWGHVRSHKNGAVSVKRTGLI